MICNLKMSFNTHNYILEFDNILNVIAGDSSTGKTSIFQIIKRKIFDKLDCNYSVVTVSSVNDIKLVEDKSLLLLDTDDTDYEVIKELKTLENRDVCICLFGRKYISNIPLSADNYYILKTKNKLTRNIRNQDILKVRTK